MSELRTLSGRLFQSLGAKYEKILPHLVDFTILGTTKSPELNLMKWCTSRSQMNIIINLNSQQYAEMRRFLTCPMHVNDNRGMRHLLNVIEDFFLFPFFNIIFFFYIYMS